MPQTPTMSKGPSQQTFVLGLTGSIGMGKSTVLAMFDDCGVPVFSADRAVHELYAKGGAGVEHVSALFPEALQNGAIDRKILAKLVLGDADALAKLEAVVHPLVRTAQKKFVETASQKGAPLIVIEIPLLFETGAQKRLDAAAVVTASSETQRTRVLARPGMTEAKLAAILKRQMPDKEKRKLADHIINSGTSLEETRKDVENLVARLAKSGAQK